MSEFATTMLNKDRQQMIEDLCGMQYIHRLEQPGHYLFGKTKNGRAVCLVWSDTNDGCVDRDVLAQAYHEIANAGLKIPFLFFGLSSLIVSPDLFTFAQLPWFFEDYKNPLLRTLQGMNMHGKLRTLALNR